MGQHIAYLLLGAGAGAALALLGIGLVLTDRSSSVLNFAHGATGMYLAYVFYEFRETGDLVFPIVGLPARVHLLARPTVASALLVIGVFAALLGAALYLLIFRRLRTAPALARVVASIGLFLYFWAMVELRFPNPPRIRRLLPSDAVDIFGHPVFRDRLYTAAIAIVLALAIAAMTRWTRFGLATTAAAESERGAALTGLNANALATVNWMMATVLAGLAMVIIAPVNQLDPLALSLLVVPALAAAMIGGFRSYLVTAGAGLLLGMCQFELMSLQINWGGLGGISLPQALPFVVILITLVVRGDALPARGERATSRLPASPEPRRIGLWAAVACGCGLTVMAFGSSDWRSAVITSAIATVMSLSVVLLTGYIGQISLAPFAFAGVGAFTLVRLGELGVPFPAAPLLAVLASVVLGLIIGLPATRARGMQLAVATLAAAVAVEALLWKWGWFVGHSGGKVPEPKIGAVDLGIAARGDDYPRAVFGVVVVVIAVAACTGLAIIRTRPTGLKWLAIRSNERAAAALAINVGRSKLLAFAASALLAGLGGVLLAYQRQSVSTDSFQVFASLSVIALTYLGGVASVSGAVLAGLLAPLGVITVLTGQDLTEVSPYAFVINAVLLIGAALLMPEGLAGLAERVRSEVGSSVTQRRVGRESVSTAQ